MSKSIVTRPKCYLRCSKCGQFVMVDIRDNRSCLCNKKTVKPPHKRRTWYWEDLYGNRAEI